ncbi:UNVERIFIED_CONTAM: hypothetical protein Sradi_4008800 [Sesamum radiatum]|uniref:RNase H type-1 domain-containing protein n=1 Tax=Sesamum radiatum TaxID=300843 RepID=A0AAW2PIU3_SESRA
MAFLQNLYRSELLKSEHVQSDFYAMNTPNIPLRPKNKQVKVIIVQWKKPQEWWFTLNMNGASKGNLGISGTGGFLRDKLGQVIFAFQEHLGIATNIHAELRAIYRGMNLSIEKGLYNIWIETDALAIIKLISTPKQGAWNYQNLLQKIRSLMSQTEANFLTSIKRVIKWSISLPIKHVHPVNLTYSPKNNSHVKSKILKGVILLWLFVAAVAPVCCYRCCSCVVAATAAAAATAMTAPAAAAAADTVILLQLLHGSSCIANN